MTLALIVYKDGPADMAKETSRLFFYVGGCAALTLVINAPLAQTLLRYLDLLGKDTTEKSLIMAQITKKLRKQMSKVLADLATEFHFTSLELEEVAQCCSLLNESDVSDAAAGVVSALHNHGHHSASIPIASHANPMNAAKSQNGHGDQKHVHNGSSPVPAGASIELREVVKKPHDDVEEGPRTSTFTVSFDVRRMRIMYFSSKKRHFQTV